MREQILQLSLAGKAVHRTAFGVAFLMILSARLLAQTVNEFHVVTPGQVCSEQQFLIRVPNPQDSSDVRYELFNQLDQPVASPALYDSLGLYFSVSESNHSEDPVLKYYFVKARRTAEIGYRKIVRSEKVLVGVETPLHTQIWPADAAVCEGEDAVVFLQGLRGNYTYSFYAAQSRQLIARLDNVDGDTMLTVPWPAVLAANGLFSIEYREHCDLNNLNQSKNLVINSDFDGGNSGFQSEYQVVTRARDLLREGYYIVADNPLEHHLYFDSCMQHDGSRGNMMILNGSPVWNERVWYARVPVDGGKNYVFKSWFASVNPNSPALLRFSVKDSALTQPIQLSGTTCSWESFYELWKAPEDDTVEIAIINQNLIRGGNDFAIDDIYFGQYCEGVCPRSRDSLRIHISSRSVQNFELQNARTCIADTLRLGLKRNFYGGTFTAAVLDAGGNDSISVGTALVEPTSDSLWKEQLKFVVSGIVPGAYRIRISAFDSCSFLLGIRQMDFELLESPQITVSSPLTQCYGNANLQIRPEAGTVYRVFTGSGEEQQLLDSASGRFGLSASEADSLSRLHLFVHARRIDTDSSCQTVQVHTVQLDSAVIALDSLVHPSCLNGGRGLVRVSSAVSDAVFSLDKMLWKSSGHFQELPSGSYRLYVRNSTGCTDSAEAVLNAPPSIDLQLIRSDSVSCSGISDGQIIASSVSDSGGEQYSLDLQNWSNSPVFSMLSSGAYWVYVRDAANCKDSVYAVVESPDAVQLHLDSLQDVFCNGGASGAVWLRAEGGSGLHQFASEQKNWKPGGQFDSLEAGNFMYYVQDSKGCLDSLYAGIAQPQPMRLWTDSLVRSKCGLSNGLIGIGTDAAGQLEYSLDKQSWQLENVFDSLSEGSYLMRIRNGNGCTDSLRAVLEGSDPLELTLDSVAHGCDGEENGLVRLRAVSDEPNVEFSRNSGAWSYSFIFDSLQAGMHEFIARNGEGCEDQIAVRLRPMPSLSLLQDSIGHYSCKDSPEGYVSVSAEDERRSCMYSVDLQHWQSSGLFFGLPEGNGKVWAQDEHGCQAVHSFAIESLEPVEWYMEEKTGLSCFGEATGRVRMEDLGHSFVYSSDSISWRPEPLFSGLEAGSHTFFARSSGGCRFEYTLKIDQPEALGFASEKLEFSGGTPPYVRAVIDSFGREIVQNLVVGSPFPMNTLAPGRYQVLVRDANGCELLRAFGYPSDFSQLQIPSALSYGSCNEGATAEVHGVPLGAKISWFDSEEHLISSDSIVKNLSNGTYRLLVESYDSSFVKTIDVHRKPAPEVSAEDMEMEYGEMNARPFKVVANKPLLEFCWYEMDDGKKKTPFVLGEDFVANPEFSAQYMLVARDESNCLDTAFVNFERTFRPPRAQDDLLEIHADETGEVNLIANDFCPYSGKEGDSVVILSHPSVGEAKFNTQTKRLEYHAPEGFSGTAELRYKLVSRLSGMESEARVVIEISDGTGIKIPEVFTPNADGLQDRFVIKKIEEFPNNHLIVYNRWGFKVYEARGYANEWDGTSQADSFIGSKVLPADTYYYVLDIGTAVYKGFVYIYY